MKATSITLSDEFEIEINNRTIHITAEVTLIHDPDYGADADGNRGVPMNEIEINDWSAEDDHGGDCSDIWNFEKIAREIIFDHDWERLADDY